MTATRAIPLAAVAGLAACAMQSAGRPGEPASLEVSEADGVIRVAGAMPAGGSDAHFHCAAAREARRIGAVEMNWLEGVVQMANGGTDSAIYRYHASRTVGAALPEGEVDKVIGAAEPIDNWFFDCSGFPAEGDAA